MRTVAWIIALPFLIIGMVFLSLADSGGKTLKKDLQDFMGIFE